MVSGGIVAWSPLTVDINVDRLRFARSKTVGSDAGVCVNVSSDSRTQGQCGTPSHLAQTIGSDQSEVSIYCVNQSEDSILTLDGSVSVK